MLWKKFKNNFTHLSVFFVLCVIVDRIAETIYPNFVLYTLPSYVVLAILAFITYKIVGPWQS